MDFINEILDKLNGYLYGYILIALLILAGLYFTIRTKFIQFRLIGESIALLREKNDNKEAVSSFQALMISTASRVGVGNIAGVATAIAIGGAGSVFWMWVMALVGAASALIESTLAQVYKIKSAGNEFRGGPAYYIERALNRRWLGILFSIMLIACFAYGFNGLQANNIVSSLAHYFGGNFNSMLIPGIVGAILALGTAYVIYGGQEKIAFMTSVIVPIMAVMYLVLGIIVIARNISALPGVFVAIFRGAFDFEAIFGGFAGSAVVMGIKRGLFSNEAGMGSAPNAAASAHVSHPVKQGLVQMLSVFIDTLLICSATAFIILVSGIDTTGLKAMPLVQAAISSQFGEAGIFFITLSVFFFAFSSIIGNYYYTESNMLFILGKKTSLKIFRLSVVIAVFLGSIAGYDLVWNLADVLMGFMAMINIGVILVLSTPAVKTVDDYVAQKKEGKDPAFIAEEVGIYNTDLWKKESILN
ncbi:MAG TPA: alanine/glycine:cation symporter family protein [Clostridia bacterium]|nr:alanine/glycine:cation symporter family protein [Clostridia bacterium]